MVGLVIIFGNTVKYFQFFAEECYYEPSLLYF